METMTIIWLVLAVVMAVLEAATVQLVSIWFVIGSVAACVTSLFTDNILIQAIVFVAVTGIALIATRPLVKKIKSKKAEQRPLHRQGGRRHLVDRQPRRRGAGSGRRIDLDSPLGRRQSYPRGDEDHRYRYRRRESDRQAPVAHPRPFIRSIYFILTWN